MTAQEDSDSPQVDSIVEVHEDTDGSDDKFVSTSVAGTAAVLLFVLSIAGALIAGNVALATGLGALTVLFAASLLTGALAGN